MRIMMSVCAAAVVAGVGGARGDVYTSVPQAAGYQLVYTLPVPVANPAYNTAAIPYAVNNSALYGPGVGQIPFSRVAYFLELAGSTSAGAPNGFVFVSFNKPAVFVDGADIGVPSNGPNGSGIATNTAVANMDVFSNVAGVTTGTGLAGGKLEFWPSNFGVGANGKFDHDDDGFNAGSGHGSMQIHNTAVPQTLMAFNDWGGNSPGAPASEIGIGNNPDPNGQPDWVFGDTGNLYTVRNMQILVQVVPEPTSLAALAMGGVILRRRRA